MTYLDSYKIYNIESLEEYKVIARKCMREKRQYNKFLDKHKNEKDFIESERQKYYNSEEFKEKIEFLSDYETKILWSNCSTSVATVNFILSHSVQSYLCNELYNILCKNDYVYSDIIFSKNMEHRDIVICTKSDDPDYINKYGRDYTYGARIVIFKDYKKIIDNIKPYPVGTRIGLLLSSDCVERSNNYNWSIHPIMVCKQLEWIYLDNVGFINGSDEDKEDFKKNTNVEMYAHWKSMSMILWYTLNVLMTIPEFKKYMESFKLQDADKFKFRNVAHGKTRKNSSKIKNPKYREVILDDPQIIKDILNNIPRKDESKPVSYVRGYWRGEKFISPVWRNLKA